MSEVKEKGAKRKAAVAANGIAIKPREIKITKEIEEGIRTISTEGWIHIMPSQGKWRVRKHGAIRASGIYDDKQTAISIARKLSHSSHKAYIIVHDKNGEVIQTIAQ